MKLNRLHKSLTTEFLMEELDPQQEQKLAYIQMMVSKQGKDGQEVSRKIRGLIDPSFARKEGQKATLQRWLDGAQRGETKDGSAYGRKVRITVLESAVRDLVTEGIFKNIGAMVYRKLHDLISGERQEHELVSNALDTYRELAAIPRYAKKAEESIYDDPQFWALVDQVTNGLGDQVKNLVQRTYERIAEMKEAPDGVLTETVIHEARISQVLASLDLDRGMIDGIMRQYGLEDADYDVSRLKDLAAAAKGKYEGAKQGVKDIAAKVGGGDAAEKYRVQDENVELGDFVVKTAAALMATMEQQADTPEEVEQAIGSALGGDEALGDEYEVVSQEELY